MSTIKYNIYDKLLILFIILQIFGGIGGSLQVIRIAGIVLAPFCIIFYFETVNRKQKHLFFVLSTIYSFLLLSFLWTSDPGQGTREIAYYLDHFLLFLTVPFLYTKANVPLRSLLLGWVVFIFLTQIIAFNEIFFNQHLDVSYIGEDNYTKVNGQVVLKKFASVTFGNYNTYVMVLCFSLPFLFGALKFFKNVYLHLFVFFVICFTEFILLTNASRGGILASVIMWLLFFWFTRKDRITYLKTKLFFIIPLLFYVVYQYYEIIFLQVMYRIRLGISFTSDSGRSILFTQALEAFYENPFVGGGIGSMKQEMGNAYILAPHNLFLEILMQFGLMVFIVFMLFLYKVYRKSLMSDKEIKIIGVCALISLPVIAIINSGYLLHTVLWIYLGSLYSISFLKRRQKHLLNKN